MIEMSSSQRDASAVFRVASTWDGNALGEGEVSELRLTASNRGWTVDIDAPLHGDPSPATPAGSLDGLWEYEVVELFVAGNDGRYIELEFGPHGHYLALRFDAVRHRAGPPFLLDFSVSRAGERWQGEAFLTADVIPAAPHRANAFAIHGVARRNYLAATPLPGPTPDFHQPERFPRVSLPRINHR